MVTVEISRELKSFCEDYIVSLGSSLDFAIREEHQEYEAGFNRAIDFLTPGPTGSSLHSKNIFSFKVSIEDRQKMLAEIKQYAQVAGIPYNKLSPLNQFIVTIPPFIFYCLKNYLIDSPKLQEEASRLMSTPEFPRYLQESLGYPISQIIKGAFWKPNPSKFLGRLFGIGH
jgi:hypothetical protein